MEKQILGELRNRLRNTVEIWCDLQMNPDKKRKGKPSVFLDDMTFDDTTTIKQWHRHNRDHTDAFNDWIKTRYPNVVKQRLGNARPAVAVQPLPVEANGSKVFVEKAGLFVEKAGLCVEKAEVFVEKAGLCVACVEPIDDPYVNSDQDDAVETVKTVEMDCDDDDVKQAKTSSCKGGEVDTKTTSVMTMTNEMQDVKVVTSTKTSAFSTKKEAECDGGGGGKENECNKEDSCNKEKKFSNSKEKDHSKEQEQEQENTDAEDKEPACKKRRLCNDELPPAKNGMIANFPTFGFNTMLYTNEGTHRETGILWFFYEASVPQPNIAKTSSLVFGDLWVRSADFLRFVGPRRNVSKFRERMAHLDLWTIHKAGAYKEVVVTTKGSTNTKKEWFVKMGHLIALYQSRPTDNIASKLITMRLQVQAELDSRRIALVS